MDLAAIRAQIIHQQLDRFPDRGPDLHDLGRAVFRVLAGNPQTYHANVVGFAQTTAEMANDFIRRIIDYYRPMTTELLWQINEGECAFDLSAMLQQNGFTLDENLLVMIMSNRIVLEPDKQILVRDVRTRSDMAQYELIASTVFGGRDIPPPRHMLEAAAERRWQMHQAGWTRYYLGYFKDQPVGTVAVTNEKIPLIQTVATLKHARGRGIASAMVTFASNLALDNGSTVTSLYVERDSNAERIYRRLGFMPLFGQEILRLDLKPLARIAPNKG